jgi:hypothetical protein
MAPTGKTSPLSSRKERGSRPSSLDSARRLQTEAMESRTARRVGELMGDVEVPNRRAVASPDGAIASPNMASLRNMSSSSPMLEYTKRTQSEAVAFRTAKRIGELTGSAGRTSASSSPVIQRASQNRSPPSYFEVMGSSPELKKEETPLQKRDTPVLPGPTVSRNITQRRSRGRSRDDEPMAAVSSILARRPRGRSKDRRYSIASTTGFPVPDSDPDASFVGSHWRPARAMVEPKTQPLPERTHVSDQHGTARDGLRSPNPRLQSSDGASGGNGFFLRQLIPEEEVDPQLRAHLLELWDQRQAASVAMNMALDDDDEYHYEAYSDKFNQLNDEIYACRAS